MSASCVHVCVRACARVRMSLCLSPQSAFQSAHACACACACACLRTSESVCQVHSCLPACVHVSVCVCSCSRTVFCVWDEYAVYVAWVELVRFLIRSMIFRKSVQTRVSFAENDLSCKARFDSTPLSSRVGHGYLNTIRPVQRTKTEGHRDKERQTERMRDREMETRERRQKK